MLGLAVGWFFRRRAAQSRKSNAETHEPKQAMEPMSELDDQAVFEARNAHARPSELPTEERAQELADLPIRGTR